MLTIESPVRMSMEAAGAALRPGAAAATAGLDLTSGEEFTPSAPPLFKQWRPQTGASAPKGPRLLLASAPRVRRLLSTALSAVSSAQASRASRRADLGSSRS